MWDVHGAVAGVDNDRRDIRIGKRRRTFLFMPHDDGIRPHGRYGKERISETFPFDDGAAAGREVDDARIKIFCGQLKGTARTRTRFPKHIDNGFTVQKRRLLVSTVDDIFHPAGRSQNKLNLFFCRSRQPE